VPDWVNNSPQYHAYSIPELQDNPLIACLEPPPADFVEASLRLLRRPSFSENERNLDSATRMLLPARLADFFVPNHQHVEIFGHIHRQILTGYIQRNPMKRQGQQLLHNAAIPGVPGSGFGFLSPSTIAFVQGLSGLGKSALMRAIMRALGPAVIRHSKFKDAPFTETQILFLMRNVPDQCGPKALAKTLGDYTDELLQKNLYGKLFSDRAMTRTEYVALLRRIVANHFVGALILDELQNLTLAGTVGQRELIALFVNIRDELGVPIILVGTYKAAAILADSASTARRLVEGGFHELHRPTSAIDKEWQVFCQIIWSYQWVRKPLDLKDDIVSSLYDISQGITGIALNVFIAAQVEAINSGAEKVSADLLRTVWRRRFGPLHKIIEAIRSQNSTLLSHYDDLYSNAFSQLRADPLLGRVDEIRKQITRAQENHLGIDLPRRARKGTPPIRKVAT
jgi:hypothetical protein